MLKKPKTSSNKRRLPDVFHGLAKTEIAEDVDFIQKAIQGGRPPKRQKTESRAPRGSTYNVNLAQQCDLAVSDHKTQSTAARRLREKLQKTREEIAAYRREVLMLAREETKLRSVYNTVKTDMEDKRVRVGELRQTLEEQLELVRQNLVHEQTRTRDAGNKMLGLQKMDQELRKKDLRVRSLESEVEQLKLKLQLSLRSPNSPPLRLPPLPFSNPTTANSSTTATSTDNGTTTTNNNSSSTDGAAANSTSGAGDRASDTPKTQTEASGEQDDTLTIFVAQLTKRERDLQQSLEKMNFYRESHEQSKNRASAIKHQLQEARAQVQKLQMDHSAAKAKLLRMEKEQDKLRESNDLFEKKLTESDLRLQHETDTNGLLQRQKDIADERALFAEKSLKEVLLQVETYASGLNTLQNQYNSLKEAYDEARRERDEHARRLKNHNDKKVGPSKEPTPDVNVVNNSAELERMQSDSRRRIEEAVRNQERAERSEKETLDKLKSMQKTKRSQDSDFKSLTRERDQLHHSNTQLETTNGSLKDSRASIQARVTSMEKIIVVQADANNCLLEEINNMNQQIKRAERLFQDKKQEIDEFRKREDERFKKELSSAMGLTQVQGLHRRAAQGSFNGGNGVPHSTTNLAEENPPPHAIAPEESPPPNGEVDNESEYGESRNGL